MKWGRNSGTGKVQHAPYDKTLMSVTFLIILVFSPDFVGKYFNKNILVRLTVDRSREPVRVQLFLNLAFYKTTPFNTLAF